MTMIQRYQCTGMNNMTHYLTEDKCWNDIQGPMSNVNDRNSMVKYHKFD